MKKIVILLMIVLPAMLATGRAYAQEFTFGNIKYNITSTDPRTVEVVENESPPTYSGNVTIPKSVVYSDDTYTVTAIGSQAFGACTGLESVVIPNSVEAIGYAAFINCTGLKSVVIGNSVETIGVYAFAFCTGLKSVVIGNSVEIIGSAAFRQCTGLESVVIPNSVKGIRNEAFAGCDGLKSVVIGNSVETIGNFAFGACTSLESVVIPNSVEAIGYAAFINCTGLKSVVIGNSVEEIGDGAFLNCGSLAEIIVKAETPPTITGYTFYGFSGAINVPCNKEVAYKGAPNWSSYDDLITENVPHDITLESNDETMGEAAVTKKNTCADNTATIKANAKSGYRFVQWNDANTDNPRTVTVTEDVTYTATFAPAAPPAYSPVLLQDLEDAVVCRGESHTFKIVAEGENLSYEWYYGNELIKGASGNNYTITNAEFRDYERYYVIVRSHVGESHMSVYSKNVRLWVADYLPETLQFAEYPSTAITGQSYRIKLAGYSDVTQYSWNYDRDGVTFSPATGGVGENETRATFGILSEGLGTLTVTLTHPCGTRQATQAIVVNYPAGTGEVTVNEIAVSPNPTSGIIKVSGTKANQTICIVDITGSLKGSFPAQDGTTTIDLSGYTKGTYLVHYDGKTYKVIRK